MTRPSVLSVWSFPEVLRRKNCNGSRREGNVPHVSLPESDKPAMRFLWRESPDKEPVVYQFKRTVFEEMSAPSRANYTMRRNADKNGEDLPLGVKAV